MAKTTIARFAINVDSGVVTFRSKSTDALPTLWKLIDDETASAIIKKKVDAKAVIEAIQKSIFKGEAFNFKEYDAKRREELKRFNVSERDMVPDVDADPNEDEKQEQENEEVLSLKDLGFGGKPNKNKAAEKPSNETSVKENENNHAEEDGITY